MNKIEWTKEDDWTPESELWNDFSKYKPEDSALCVVECIDYKHPEHGEVYDYEIRFFENRERCINNWFDVKRWKYLYE